MKKHNIILSIFLIALLLIIGCSKKNEQNSNEQRNQNQEQQIEENQLPRWNENFEEAGSDDLIIDQQILVMGTENSDGSISANEIMIGNTEADFENMGGFEGQRGNFEQMQNSSYSERFQNMSDEERAKFMVEMRVQREASGGSFPRANMRGGTSRLNGEIIDKDDTTITLKLEDGGSKLIFFSDSTRVSMIKRLD